MKGRYPFLYRKKEGVSTTPHGFKPAHQTMRYVLKGLPNKIAKHKHIVPLAKIGISTISDYDRQMFPARREAFLQSWINQAIAVALSYVEDDQLKGFGVIRECYQGYKVGPLFADNAEIAIQIWQALLSKIDRGPVYLDVPEPNQAAIDLVKQFTMRTVYACIRMYSKCEPDIDLQRIYGITTFELG